MTNHFPPCSNLQGLDRILTGTVRKVKQGVSDPNPRVGYSEHGTRPTTDPINLSSWYRPASASAVLAHQEQRDRGTLPTKTSKGTWNGVDDVGTPTRMIVPVGRT